jgi:hypothetical protein
VDYCLRWASANGHLGLVKYLVSIGADVRACNGYVLRKASSNGHLEVVRHLVSLGVDARARDDYAIRYASVSGHLEVVLSGPRRHYGHLAHYAVILAAVRMASRNGHLGVVKYLVSLGADVMALNNQAVRMATEVGYTEVVEVLASPKLGLKVETQSQVCQGEALNIFKFVPRIHAYKAVRLWSKTVSLN